MVSVMRSVVCVRLFILALHSSTLVSAACYYPNGKLAPNDTPCRDDTKNSVCCGQGYACLSNGICQATGEELEKPGATEFVRGGCTDKTWRSSNCPLFCIEPGVDNTGGGMGIGKCSDTESDMYWCINKNQDDVDCEDERGVLFFPGTPSVLTTIGISPSTSTSSSIPTSSSEDQTRSRTNNGDLSTISQPIVTTFTSVRSEAPSITDEATGAKPNEPQGSTENKGAIIGGAVGGSAAVLILGAIILWWWWVKVKKQRAPETVEGPEASQVVVDVLCEAPAPAPAWGHKENQPAQLYGSLPDIVPHELPAGANDSRR